MPTAGLILLSFNLILLIAVVLGFLGGVIKGLYKSLFYLVFSIVFFALGVIAIPFITEMLIDMDLSFLGNILPSDFNVELTSIRETLPELLANLLSEQGDLFAPGSESLALALGIVKLVLNIVLFIVLIILNATILKIIPLIIWLFIRPKKHPLACQRPGKLRLLGGMVGAIKGFAATLLIAIPLSGISSLAAAIEPIYESMAQAESETTGNNSGIVTLAAEENDELIKDGLKMLKSYQDSILGQIFGIGDLDVTLFDYAFKINVKTEDTNTDVYLRNDIVRMAKIYEIVLNANDNSTKFDPSFLFKVTEAELLSVQKEVKGITILNIAKNIGAEYGYDYLVRENLIEGYETLISIETLKSLDINKELETLIDVVIIISESENQEELFDNAFSLTKEEAIAVFDKLSELQVIQLGLPIAANFALNMPETIKTMEDNNIDPNDLNRPTQEELLSDFKNIVNIYTLAKDMGFEKTEDLWNVDQTFLVAIEDVHVVELFAVVFDFSFLYNNDELFANLVYDFVSKQVPQEYLDIVSRDTLVDNFNASELSSIALLGKLLYTESLFEQDVNINFVDVLREENVEKISTYISESNILSEGFLGVMSVFTKDIDLVEIVIPANYSFKGAAGKTEIKAILRSIRNIFEMNLTSEDVDFGAIPDEKIDEISTNFSSSLIIRYNLSPIITQMISKTEYTFITSDEDESFWTKEEIYYTLRALKIFVSEDIDQASVHTIEDEKVLEISKSQTIANAVGQFLDHENESGGMLDDQLVIPEDLTYHSTETETGELYYFFLGLKEILGDSELENFDIEVSAVLDMDLDLIFESKILEATIVEKHLKVMHTEPNLGKYIFDKYEDGTDFDWYKDVNPNNLYGDSIPLILALGILDEYGITYGSMNYVSYITVLTTNPLASQEINDAVISSAVLTASLPKMLNELINVQAELDLDIYPNYNKEDALYWGEDGVNKELFFILDGLVMADEIKDFDYETLDDTNKDDFKLEASKIAKSETLRQLLPKIIEDSNLTKADDFRSAVDPKTLTEAEWLNEIDVLVDIIVILNENPTLDFDNPTPQDIPVITEIILLMTNSLLYDETKVIL